MSGGDAPIPAARAWNTWDADAPATTRHLPSGLTITPVAFSSSLDRTTRFPMGPGVRLGRRSIDGAAIALELAHGGTRLEWTWSKPDAGTVVARWRTIETGEWGLRFWLVLALGFEDGTPIVADPRTGRVSARRGGVALTGDADKPPLLVTVHDRIEELEREFAERGYFYLGSRGSEGRVLALRFNLEEMPENRVSFTLDADDGTDGASRSASVGFTARQPAALEAIEDVVAWNTVHDPVNRRPYTALSRFWNLKKFGGFGVWLDDIFYHALMAGLFDPGVARENLAAVTAGQTEAGNLPCLLTGNDRWVDRSQPPIGAYVVAALAERIGDAGLVERYYPALARNHAWWWRARDPLGTGLVAYGSSDVGDGLYKGTALGCRNESAMDNSPVHDEFAFDPATRTLDGVDVGLNSLLALDAELLAGMAERLGLEAEAAAHRATAARLAERISTCLWDEARGVFANRHRDGRFVRAVAPTSFFPLLCGAATAEQRARLLADWFDPPARFGGRFRLTSVARDDPAYGDNVYWRGRTWPPLNFLTWLGLRRAGEDARAAALAADSWSLFAGPWAADRIAAENYSADTGEATDQPDTDTFYGWSALLPYMAVADRLDCCPFDGLTVRAGAGAIVLGPLASPLGPVTLEERGGLTTLSDADGPLLRSDLTGQLKRLTRRGNGLSVELPQSREAGASLWIRASADVEARLDDRPIATTPDADGLSLALPHGGGRLVVGPS
ncbi:MAG: trehalase family glycosidase [Azospirillaceae bacterium]